VVHGCVVLAERAHRAPPAFARTSGADHRLSWSASCAA
jgi:hypothetical protein